MTEEISPGLLDNGVGDGILARMTHAIAAAPRYAAQHAHDCARCERPEVKPVWLVGPDGNTRPYGASCAARMLGRPASHARRVRDEATAAQQLVDWKHEMNAQIRAAAQQLLDTWTAPTDGGAGRARFVSLWAGAQKCDQLPVPGMGLRAFVTYLAEHDYYEV